MGTYKKNFGILYLSVSQTLSRLLPCLPWRSFCSPLMLASLAPSVMSILHLSVSLHHHVGRPEGGLTGTLWNLAGTDCKSYPWHAGIPFNATGWRLPAWGATLWKRSWRVSRMEGAGGLSLSGEAEEPGLVQPREDTASGDKTAAPQGLWGWHGVGGARLFTAVQDRRMRDNRHKLKEESFRVDIRKHFSLWGETGSGAGCSERLHGLCP